MNNMATFKVNKTSNYTVMSNYHLRDKSLSLKGKGLLSVMLSLPPEWDYSIAGLASILKENITAVKSALNELKDTGYLKVTKLYANQTSSGHIEYVYDVYEEPQLKHKIQPIENLCLEPQHIEPNMQINKDKSNIDKQIRNKEEVVEEGVNDLGAFAHLNRNNQQQTTNNSTNNEFAEKDIQDHPVGEGSVETERSATMTPQGVGREGGASQPDGAKPHKKFYYIKDLDKQTLENLKQDVLENRFQEEGSLTYRDIQKKYSLIDNLEFDTPLYIDSLLTLREQGEKQEQRGIRYY